jgi:hypothetical protein
MIRGVTAVIKGVGSMAWPWRLWVGLLAFLNLIAPLAFLNRPDALWTLAAMAAAAVSMVALAQFQGFTRLLGLGHIWWAPLIWYLVDRGALSDPGLNREWFVLWRDAVVAANALSLVIDAGAVGRFLAGDRGNLNRIKV